LIVSKIAWRFGAFILAAVHTLFVGLAPAAPGCPPEAVLKAKFKRDNVLVTMRRFDPRAEYTLDLIADGVPVESLPAKTNKKGRAKVQFERVRCGADRYEVSVRECGLEPARVKKRCVGGERPANDACADAVPLTVPTVVSGTTIGATVDFAPECRGVQNDSPGVWYRVVGNNREYTVSLCGGASYRTAISVYRGGCDGLVCETANASFCGDQSQVTFCALGFEPTVYWILIHSVQGEAGDFDLRLTQSQLECAAP